jgi:hypothetical protein
MHSYLQWYQEAAAHLSRNHPQVRIINASAAGAFIPGFSRGYLPELLASLPLLSRPLCRVAGLLSSLPLPDKQMIMPRVEKAHQLLSRPFSSYEDMAAHLAASPLRPWLEEEISRQSWRRSLAHARLIVEALLKEA